MMPEGNFMVHCMDLLDLGEAAGVVAGGGDGGEGVGLFAGDASGCR